MSDKDITLTVEERNVLGKKVKHLRSAGKIPAVIHNHGANSIIVMAPALEVQKVYAEAGKHHPVTVQVGKDKHMAIIRDVDFEPTKRNIRHVVFNAIKQDEKVETEVPVHFIEGEIPAEKAGLMVIRQLETVQIEALPKDLVDELTVDVSQLAEIGDKVTVAGIQVPPGVTILTEPEHPIATVEETKAQISEEAEETEATEGEAAEGESTEDKKESDEEE